MSFFNISQKFAKNTSCIFFYFIKSRCLFTWFSGWCQYMPAVYTVISSCTAACMYSSTRTLCTRRQLCMYSVQGGAVRIMYSLRISSFYLPHGQPDQKHIFVNKLLYLVILNKSLFHRHLSVYSPFLGDFYSLHYKSEK